MLLSCLFSEKTEYDFSLDIHVSQEVGHRCTETVHLHITVHAGVTQQECMK